MKCLFRPWSALSKLDFGLGNLLLFLFSLCLIALPAVSSVIDLQAHDFSRLVQMGLMSIATLLILSDVLKAKFFFLQHVRWCEIILLMSLAFLVLMSTWNAEIFKGALLEVAFLTSFLLLVISTASALRGKNFFHWTVWIVLSSTALLSVSILVRYVAGMVEGLLLRAFLVPGFSNYRFFNHIQCLTIPLLTAAVLWPEIPKRAQKLGWALLSAEFCWLLFTGGRATMLALTSSAVVVAFLYRAQARMWLSTLLKAALIGGAFFVLLFVALPTYFGVKGDFSALDTVERTVDDTALTRRFLWKLAIDDVAESPLIGIGPQHFAHRPNPEAAHPHNIYLQIAAEWGLPMFALLLVIVIYGFRRFVRVVRRQSSAEQVSAIWGVGLTAVFIAIAVDGTLSGNFVMPNSQMWIVFALALAIVYVRKTEGIMQAPSTSMSNSGVARAVMVVGVIATQVALWWGAWPEISDVPAHIEQVQKKVPNTVLNPRFWSHGWF